MKIVEIISDDAVRRGLENGDIGWAVRDVRPGIMNQLTSRAGWRQWSALVKSKSWRIVDLPIRQLIASQKKVNPDFRDAVLRYVPGAEDELPVVVKKSGHLVIMDGHHRIADAAYRGAQTVRCRYHDFDAPVPEPMTLFSERAALESPEFRSWFAGSHVVDQSGQPLMVFHGTSQQFDTFRKSRPIRDAQARRYAYNRDRHIGIWFSDNPESASFFSRQGKTGWQGSHLIPVYLSMKNPLVHDFGGAPAKSPEMNLALAAQAKREGRDGLILRDLRDAPTGDGENVYIVFRPTQVKSAIGNSTYRTDSPRITETAMAHPRTFYKGYNPGDERRIQTGYPYWDSLFFVSSDRASAAMYGKNIRIFDAVPDARIVYEGTRAFISLAKGLPRTGRMIDNCIEIVRRAASAGYDAVWFRRQGDVGTVILNRDKFVERKAPTMSEATVAKTPTAAFLTQVDRLRTDPGKPMLGVGRDYEFKSIEVAFNLRPINDNTVILQSLKSGNPRSGEGSQAMFMLCKWADVHGVTLLLDAGPFSTRAVNPPMDRQTLMSWYMRFGFTPTAENATEMIRPPGSR